MVASPREMFERHVIRRRSGCWLWKGGHNKAGYGSARLTCLGGKSILAHRLSWLVHKGAIPDGLHVLHHCDNPGCVRPAHLFVGTDNDNTQDRVRKGRPGCQFFKGKSTPVRRVRSSDAAQIIKEYTGRNRKELAARYGIAPEYVWKIATGRVELLPW